MVLLSLGVLIGSCFLLLLMGGWIPLVPAAIAIILAGSVSSLDVLRNKE
jgi:CHASE2 domain-containing sensor protein